MMARFAKEDSPSPQRRPIFICYARKDNEDPEPSRRWLNRLLEHLQPLTLHENAVVWSDHDLQAGDDWHGAITEILHAVRIAVLLVSPAFLASQYIANSELPVLFMRAREEGVIILPLILKPCLFVETRFRYPDPSTGPQEISLASLQAANSPQKALSGLSEHEQDQVLLQVAKRIREELRLPGEPPRPSPGPSSIAESAWMSGPLRPVAVVLVAALVGIALLGWQHYKAPETDSNLRMDLEQVNSRRVTPPDMVFIRGGRFTMGSSAQDIALAQALCRRQGGSCQLATYEPEQPQRQLEVDDFYLDRTEVTNAAFATWLNAQVAPASAEPRPVKQGQVLLADLRGAHSGLRVDGESAKALHYVPRPHWQDRPVVQITWEAARRYCAAQNKRLPTEAEWEFAARGSENRTFPWGFEPPECGGVAFGRTSQGPCKELPGESSVVGTAHQDRTPNPDGVRDLGGNAGEWVLDWYTLRYRECAVPCRNPVVDVPADTLRARVIRGGDFTGLAAYTRAAGRTALSPEEVRANVGFRCARDGRRR